MAAKAPVPVARLPCLPARVTARLTHGPPPLHCGLTARRQKAYQLTSFIVSLLLSQRLGRAYDHWTKTLTAFAGLSRVIVDVVQDATLAKADAAVTVGEAACKTSG